jgi:hypothetical protein
MSGRNTTRAIPNKYAPLNNKILKKISSPFFNKKGKIAPTHTTNTNPT